MTRAQQLIAALGLEPHPEKGHYARTYSAPLQLSGSSLPHGAPRPACTAIYFLLGDAERTTHLHRLKSDELFHLYEGGPLDVLLLPPTGEGQVARLGRDVLAGERPQLVIPAGTWFGTELPDGVEHCLWGCTVAPGFDYADFTLGDRQELIVAYPDFAEMIGALTGAAG